MKPVELEPVISARQLAARYGWKNQTERLNRVKGRTPPFLKIGGRILYRVRDVEEWERARRFHHTAEMTAAVRDRGLAAAR